MQKLKAGSPSISEQQVMEVSSHKYHPCVIKEVEHEAKAMQKRLSDRKSNAAAEQKP